MTAFIALAIILAPIVGGQLLDLVTLSQARNIRTRPRRS